MSSTLYTYNKQQFNADVTYTNTSTQFNTSGLLGISGGIVSISGGVINISGPSVKISNLGAATTATQLYIDNTTGLITKGVVNRGPTGANGTNGTTGSKGATGDQGSQGAQVSYPNVYYNGYLGIGAPASYPLYIARSSNKTDGINPSTWFDGTSFNKSVMLYIYGGTSLYMSEWTMSNGYLSFSDNRIKDNIVDIDDGQALQTLRLIKPKTYEYVDKLRSSNDSVIGFISQEIKEIIPKAVSISKDYIPNFYTKCTVSATDSSSILLVTSPIDLSWNPLHDDQSGNAFVDAAGNACSDASGNKQFKIRFYDKSNNEIECKTTDVLDKRHFLMDITDTKFLDASGNIVLEKDGGYFLHGQKVDDFHNLDKNAIFTVVTAAVQDIDRSVQADAAKIQVLESKKVSLESRIAILKQTVAALVAANTH